MNQDDATIFAKASGSGRAAITVLRLSGPACASIIDRICRSRPAARQAALRTLHDPSNGDVLDRALVLWFPGPGSYTGEDAAELHLHGGVAVSDAVSDTLVRLGARPAEPGEFTQRAFRNGRLDLLEAEGVADLIEAETQAQRRQALRQADGALSRLYDSWSNRLRHLLAHQEALIDFPDEDLPEEVEDRLQADLASLQEEIGHHLAQGEVGERIRSGLFFAIIGPPNVGKSSLLNRLAGRDAAIVSDVAGTTRDALEVRLVLGDVPVTLIDTAGLRDTKDPVEAEGVRRARKHAEQADLVLVVRDPKAVPTPAPVGLRIWNKCDTGAAPEGWLPVSARTGENIPRLLELLETEARRLTATAGAPPTRARHRAGLAETVGFLSDARQEEFAELRGEALRLALRTLGRLTGAVGVEDLLDTVFGQFCIGK